MIANVYNHKYTLLREHKNCVCMTLRLQELSGSGEEVVLNFKDIEAVRQFAQGVLTLVKDQPDMRHPT